jgi:RecB family exonuclease
MTHIPLQTDVRRISHNQLSNWYSCPKKWEYIYVDKIVTKNEPSYFRKGSLVHELLSAYDQFLQQGAIPGDPSVVSLVMQVAKDEYAGQWASADAEVYLSALLAVRRFIKDHSRIHDVGTRIVAVEEKFQIELTTQKGRPFILEGIIDRLYEKHNRLYVLDRKTTGAAQHWTENQLLMDSQLLTYGALLRELGWSPYGFEIDSIVTYPYKDYNAQPLEKLFKRLTSIRSDAEMTFALNQYRQAVDAMFDVLESETEIPYNFGKHCSTCPYMPICLYTMKGIDTSVVLRNQFKPRPQA